MNRIRAEFTTSAARPTQFPADGLPEIALAGRSNVGKSSLINSLVGVRGLARTSAQPGRTQLLNFFRLALVPRPGEPPLPLCYLVDMPGYGYAKVSREQQAQWHRLVADYLSGRPQLRAVIQIVDLRHPPSADDVQMWGWLRYYGRPRLLLATKADKVSATRRQGHRQVIADHLGLTGDEPCLLYSAVDGTGREELGNWLEAAAGGR